MAGPSDFASGGARAFVLEIAGLSVRWWSGTAPPSANVPVLGTPYDDVEAVVGVSGIRASLHLAGGVADYDAVQVTLAGNARRTLTPDTDPVVVLGRCGIKSSRALSYLDVDVSQSGAVGTLTLIDNAALAGFTSGLVHVDAESFVYAGTSGYDLTGVTRAAASSRQQAHLIDKSTGSAPQVTADVVAWRGRRAVLKMAPIRNGAVGDYSEVMRGFIESTPTVSDDSLRVTVSLAPLTALLDVEIQAPTGATATRLLEGWHWFDEGYADTIEVVQEIPHNAWRELSTAASAVGSGSIGVNNAEHKALFDPAGLATPNHPRNGAFVISSIIPSASPCDPSGYGGGAILVRNGAPYTAVSAGDLVASTGTREAKRAQIAEGLHRWPDAAVDAMATNFNPPDHLGLGGAWASVNLALTGVDGAALRIRPVPNAEGCTVDLRGPGTRQFSGVNYFGGVSGVTPYDREPMLDDVGALWFGLDLAQQAQTVYPRTDSTATQAQRQARWTHTQRDIPVTGRTVPIRGVADAWYQTGELSILADGDVPIYSGAQTSLEIEYFDRALGEMAKTTARIASTTARTHPVSGAVVGYSLHLLDEDVGAVPSFGVWGGNPVTLHPLVTFDSNTASEVLLQILMSGGGEGVNGSYDVQPSGANLDATDVDVDSVLSIASPPGLASWSFRAPDGSKLRELIDPILIATQSALVLRMDDAGVMKLSRTRIGPEVPGEYVETIEAGDWRVDDVPTWGVDDDFKNRVEISLDYDPITDEPFSTVQVPEWRSIRAHNGETATLELELRGAALPARSIATAAEVLRPVYSMIFATMANERRTFSGGVTSGAALLAQLGAVYRVSSPHLRGYGDAMGVVEAAGRVVEAECGLWTADGRVTLTHYDAASTGWNASALITARAAAVVTVAAAEYSSDDVSWFAVGDSVRVVPLGDEDGATTHTVTAIAGHNLTLAPAPTVAAPWGDLVADVAASASTVHRALVFAGDIAGQVDGVDGFEFG